MDMDEFMTEAQSEEEIEDVFFEIGEASEAVAEIEDTNWDGNGLLDMRQMCIVSPTS